MELDIRPMTLMQLIEQLRQLKTITVAELESLPTIYKSASTEDKYTNERTIAVLTVEEIERIIRLARKYIYPLIREPIKRG